MIKTIRRRLLTVIVIKLDVKSNSEKQLSCFPTDEIVINELSNIIFSTLIKVPKIKLINKNLNLKLFFRSYK